jgi:hypothetical protein
MDTNISEMSLYDDFTLTDPENIESLLSLHRSILANQSVIEKGSEDDSLRLTDYTPYPFDDADHPAYELGYAWVNLSYTLKDGRTVSRSYHAIPFELTEPVKEILQSEGYLTAIAEKVQEDADYLKGLSEKDLNDLVRADDYTLCLALPSFGSDSYYSETLTLTGDMQNDLLDALAQDIADRPAGSWISPATQPIATLEYSYERDNNERFTWEDYTFNLYETDARVLALLQQYGYYDGEEILPNRSYTLQMSSADAMIVTTDDYDYLKASGDLRVFHFAGTGLGYSMEKYLMEKVDYDNGSGTYRTYLGDTTIPGGSIDVTDRMVNRDFTEEELLTLRSLTLQVAYSEQPMDVLYLDGYTALIPPENLAAVRAILYGE